MQSADVVAALLFRHAVRQFVEIFLLRTPFQLHGVLHGHHQAVRFVDAFGCQCLFLGLADARRIGLEHDADDRFTPFRFGHGFGISPHLRTVGAMFAQAAIRPCAIRVEVVADLHVFGRIGSGPARYLLAAAVGPCAVPTVRNAHLQPVGIDRNIIGTHLARREGLGVAERGVVHRAEVGLDGHHTLACCRLRDDERLVGSDVFVFGRCIQFAGRDRTVGWGDVHRPCARRRAVRRSSEVGRKHQIAVADAHGPDL